MNRSNELIVWKWCLPHIDQRTRRMTLPDMSRTIFLQTNVHDYYTTSTNDIMASKRFDDDTVIIRNLLCEHFTMYSEILSRNLDEWLTFCCFETTVLTNMIYCRWWLKKYYTIQKKKRNQFLKPNTSCCIESWVVRGEGLLDGGCYWWASMKPNRIVVVGLWMVEGKSRGDMNLLLHRVPKISKTNPFEKIWDHVKKFRNTVGRVVNLVVEKWVPGE